MKNIKIIFLIILSCILSACSGFFDKDNTPTPTPLVRFTPERSVYSVWSSSTGSGAGCDHIKLVPALSGTAIYTADINGTVTATDKRNGATIWRVGTGINITGGPGARDGLVIVGGREGDVVALSQCNGQILWRAKTTSEILAAPAAKEGVVLVKSIDGRLAALSAQDGHLLWHYDQSEPTLILRGASAPQITDSMAVVGFENGNLVNLSLHNGRPRWQQAIAEPEGSFAIQRMIDIDADPLIFNRHLYAATYQGRISSMDLSSGKPYWTHDISSYTGLDADHERVYVTDAASNLWAFDADSGTVDWRLCQLGFRNTSGPVIMGNYIVVGDGQGYLHWISQQDGHFVARVRVDRSPILATPVVDNNVLYVLTQSGRLAAYTLG